MKPSALVILILSVFIGNTQGLWQNFRTSSITEHNTIFVQYESDLQDSTIHYLSYYDNQEWIRTECESTASDTYGLEILFNNDDPLPLSLSILTDTGCHITPGLIAIEGSPTLQQMNLVFTYERDNAIENHVNIAGEYIVFTENRVQVALTNFGSGFRTRDGVLGPFYSYSVSFWHSDEENPEYVYSLIYTVDLPPFINSGLYKIRAADDTMERIGSIDTVIDLDDNALFLSCSLTDLLEDDDFAGGFNEQSGLYFSTITQKIENFGNTVTVQDQGNIHRLYAEHRFINPFINSLPQLSNIDISGDDDFTVVTLLYFDEQGHFPIVSELITDNHQIFPFVNKTNNFSDSVSFVCRLPDDWSSGTIRFSDNGYDFIEIPVYSSIYEEPMPRVTGSLKIYPNPFSVNHSTNNGLNMRLTGANSSTVKYTIRNLKGQRIYTSDYLFISPGETNVNIPKNALINNINSSGVYLITVEIGDMSETGKFLYVH